jgi:HPt (histidine-containing phosphotransfer) domain-containing protein
VSTVLTLPGNDIPVIDESRMENEFGGAPEILAELRDLFLEHAPQLHDTLREALAAGDGQVIADTAHSLKGACATYGAERLTIVCKEMELAARAGDMDSARAYEEALEQEYEAVVEAVGRLAVG